MEGCHHQLDEPTKHSTNRQFRLVVSPVCTMAHGLIASETIEESLLTAETQANEHVISQDSTAEEN